MGSSEGEHEDEATKNREQQAVYVDIKKNGRTTFVIVDTGATHNFIIYLETRQLGEEPKSDENCELGG